MNYEQKIRKILEVRTDVTYRDFMRDLIHYQSNDARSYWDLLEVCHSAALRYAPFPWESVNAPVMQNTPKQAEVKCA